MSKPAVLFLLMALVSASLLWIGPGHAEWLSAAAKVVLSISGVSLAVALLIGKRVKFDPVLR
ncbi:hypothetical protein SAMN05216588_1145 [Pseudomonas flavescens]|uniref:Uncharacterized protein n=1 Tax=Phytopseudomonas flavescens TaxID=29435 RepID=A0A1G8J6M1_9GAMM|nr:PA3371 family protein [Pseudomonas flavescens]SDI26826.1 hypothetical protein SAMN05216588_1145 [Pseudomonas flavescens]